MELNKYIPGDLAMINGDIVKIMAVCFNYNLNIIQNYDVMFPNGNIYKYEAESLKEIPLTPEILKKNGWTKGEYRPWGKGRIEIEQCNETEFMYCKGDLKVMLPYIHSLQHFLFGLGLKSEMEV